MFISLLVFGDRIISSFMLIKASGKSGERAVNKGVIAVPVLDLLIMGLFSPVC